MSTTEASMDFTRTAVIRKEDAGVNIDADRPYNLVERIWLRLWGALTARTLI